jgi:hypothetical protein
VVWSLGVDRGEDVPSYFLGSGGASRCVGQVRLALRELFPVGVRGVLGWGEPLGRIEAEVRIGLVEPGREFCGVGKNRVDPFGDVQAFLS